MKLNIRYKVDSAVLPFSYRDYLTDKIIEIATKLEIDVEYIKWIIYEAKEKPKYLNAAFPLYISRYGSDYGFRPHNTNEIWISTTSIHKSSNIITRSISDVSMWGTKRKKDFLAKVIIDELVHVKTNKDHGTKEYDELHDLYTRKFFDKLMEENE